MQKLQQVGLSYKLTLYSNFYEAIGQIKKYFCASLLWFIYRKVLLPIRCQSKEKNNHFINQIF